MRAEEQLHAMSSSSQTHRWTHRPEVPEDVRFAGCIDEEATK